MKGITLLDGLLRWKQSCVYVLEGKLRTKVMQEMHDAPMVGHGSEKTTREMLGKTLYWPEMKEDVEHYIRTYIKCQSLQASTQKEVWAI